jgi:chromosome segregation ATPase
MWYLAEVQKTGIMANKAQLRLLGCQQSEQKWSVISNEEIITAEAANQFKPGMLVLVDITRSKQVQQIQEAARPLVSMLQKYSGIETKLQRLEEEIKLWEDSYSEQKKALAVRIGKLISREERLLQKKQEFKQKLDQQGQELDRVRNALSQLRQKLACDRQKLDETLQHS